MGCSGVGGYGCVDWRRSFGVWVGVGCGVLCGCGM